MALVKVNARDIILEASDGQATPTWAEVEGMMTVTINRSENEEVAATADFGSGGAYEQDIMQRGATLAVEGQMRKDDQTGALAPGQAQVSTNGGQDKVGVLSHSTYRFRYPMDTEWTIWDATTTLGENGGAVNEKNTFNFTLTKSGMSSTEAVV